MSELLVQHLEYSVDSLPVSTMMDDVLIPEIPEITAEEIQDRLAEANWTYEVIQGPGGRKYEIAVFNPDSTGPRIVRPSTSYTSIYKNPGFSLETAVLAAAIPEALHITVANFGNKPTGNMGMGDLIYVARTGRYTRGDGSDLNPFRALGSVEDMAEALDKAGLSPDYVSADVEAGRLALGLMAASESKTIVGAFLNGLDGISSTGGYARKKLNEDMKSRAERRRKENTHPYDVTPDNIKITKEKMPRVYHGFGKYAHKAPFYPSDLFHKGLVTLGHAGSDNMMWPDKHAIFNDMQAAMINQPDANITLQFNRQSKIHDIADCVALGGLVLRNLAEKGLASQAKRLSLILADGTLDQRTDDPMARARIERYATGF